MTPGKSKWVLVEYGPAGAGDRHPVPGSLTELTSEECANRNRAMVREMRRWLPADWFPGVTGVAGE